MRRRGPLSLVALTGIMFARPNAQPAPARAVQPAQPARSTASVVDPALFKGLQYRLVGPVARRTRDDGDRRAVAAPHVLHGRGERRVVQDDRRRRDLDADHRRQDSARVDGLDRRCRFRSERSSMSAPAPTACAATSRPAAACTSRPTAARPGSSSVSTTPDRSAPSAFIRPNPNIVWVAANGDAFKRERRARRLQDDRRRQDVEEGAVHHRRRRRDGRRAAARQSERRLRVDVAARAQAVDDHQRLARRRLLQEHRRRRARSRRSRPACPRELIGKANLAVTAAKPDRIYALIEAQARRRLLSLGRCRADVGTGQFAGRRSMQRPFYYTTPRRRSDQRRRRLRRRRRLLQIDRRRARRSRPCARRTATITTSGSIRKTARR